MRENEKELGKILLYDKDNIQGIFNTEELNNHIEKHGVDELIQALSWMTWKVWDIGKRKNVFTKTE